MAGLNTTPNTEQDVESKAAVATTTSEGLPEIPEYITWQFIDDYLNACDPSIKTRFDNAINRRGFRWALDAAKSEGRMNNIAPSVITDIFMESI